MSNGFLCELLLPDKPIFLGKVCRVSLPGKDGIITVLNKHAPLITVLIPGLIDCVTLENKESSFVVFGGIAEITPDRCTIFTDEATLVKEFDLKELTKRIEKAKEALSTPIDEEHRSSLENFLHQLTALH